VYWLTRPPYLRRTAAVLILVGAVAWEVRPVPTELRPYLAIAVEAGTEVTEDLVEWREVAAGVIPEPAELSGHFVASLPAGIPLFAGLAAPEPTIPDGWWALEVPIPTGTPPGSRVRLVVDVRLEPRVVPGLVIRLVGTDGIDGPTALVAVPESEAGPAAASLADGSLRTLVGGG